MEVQYTEERYMLRFAAAYYRGRALRTGKPVLDSTLADSQLEALTQEMAEEIVREGCSEEDKLYYFKRTHEDMPRVRRTLGFLKSVRFESLLDVGSGRGVFLLPFMEQFPWVRVTSLDVLAHRVQFLQDLHAGGIAQLDAHLADICSAEIREKSVDVVTMLEVLEHIPDVACAVAAAVRIARKHVVVTVPSKPDDNPEHIHLLTKDVLTGLFEAAGCTRLRFDGVNGHLFMVATIESKGE
ncbi:MAG: class I SAM-dependent methyltransferase [Clostridia bacterium]|nr:class I SAM-dependent methyltransferase [Clostridia bacterium]